MKRMTHASVFSGIGGPEVAATMLGWKNLFHCEINPFGKAVLDYWYPNSKSYDDITKTDFRQWRGKVNVLTGGFPCQPFSYAGQRRGAEDDRYLWPSMYRCIDEIRPDWVIAENVSGILTMVEQGEVVALANQTSLFDEADDVRGIYQLRETFTLERICNDLESHGYSVQPILIPACAVGAPHRRDRVFIIGQRIAPDSYQCADGRDPREDEGESREERIQERDEIRKPFESGQVRPKGKGDAPADSACGGEGTSRASGCFEGGRGDSNQQPSEWGAETEWNHRFYAILRHATDTDRSRKHEGNEHLEPEQPNGSKPFSDGREWNAADTDGWGFSQRMPRREFEDATEGSSRSDNPTERPCNDGPIGRCRDYQVGERWANFPTVSPVHRGNDGLPFNVGSLTIPFTKWRIESIKAYGNAIVPQVMYEIFRAIQEVESQK